MVKVTTRQQFQVLVQQMELNPAIARGGRIFGETKSSVDEVWSEISSRLNSCGPPTRTSEEWQRVWIHYKAKLKKKMSKIPSQQVTLSTLEQAAVDLLHIERSVSPEGNLFGLCEIVQQQDEEQNNSAVGSEQSEGTSQSMETEQMVNTTEHPPKKRMKTEDKKHLLKQLTETQSELLSTLKKIEENLSKKNHILKDIRFIKRKEYEVAKEVKEIKQKKYDLLIEERKINMKIKEKKLEILEKQLQNK